MRCKLSTTLRHVEPTKTTDTLQLLSMTKNAARRDKFRKLGQAITALKNVKLGDPDSPDYHSGRESNFHRVNGPSDGVNEIHGIGPIFKTPQWERTLR